MTGEVDHLKPGLKLPAVLLLATDGSDVLLAAMPGRSMVVVYPWTGQPGQPNPPGWDDIPGAHGSTPELEGFRDLYAALTARGVTIFGLSGQTSDYQREMAARLRLPFLILSDAEGLLAAALRLPSFTTGGETYLQRLTLVAEDGVIESVVYPVSDPAGHAAEMLKRLG
jgi:peroxiredoxin